MWVMSYCFRLGIEGADMKNDILQENIPELHTLFPIAREVEMNSDPTAFLYTFDFSRNVIWIT
jgi:hypothetical protein